MALKKFFIENKFEVYIFLLTFIVFAYFITGFHSANEGSALALTRSIVDYGTLSINNYKNLASVDISQYNGNFYSDKDPGRSFLGVPVYFADKILGFASDSQIYFSMELMTAFFSSLSVVLLFRFAKFLGFSQIVSAAVSVVYAFGTILWSFSRTFFAHPYSAFFNLAALFAVMLAIRGGKKINFVLAGVAMGVAFLLEYTNIFAIVPVALYYLYKKRFQLHNILFIIVPFLAVASLILAYNYLIFGNPFTTTYNYQYSYGNIEQIYLRTDYLKEGLQGLLFGSWRGLFYYMPVLLLSFVGLAVWLKEGKSGDKALPIVLLLSFAGILLFYAATPAWRGGNSFGPRYLLAVMPFIVLPLGKFLEKISKMNRALSVLAVFVFASLFAYSAFVSSLGSLIDPVPAESFTNPVFEHNIPVLMTGFLDSYLFLNYPQSLYVFIIIITIILAYGLVETVESVRTVKYYGRKRKR